MVTQIKRPYYGIAPKGSCRGFDVPRVVLDISSIREKTGWQPRTELESGIEDTWKWIRQQKK